MRLTISPTMGIASGEDAMCSAADTCSAFDRPTIQRTVQTATAACILIGRGLVFNSLAAGRGAQRTTHVPPNAITHLLAHAARRVFFFISIAELKTVYISKRLATVLKVAILDRQLLLVTLLISFTILLYLEMIHHFI
jgi:hypothetical protein